MIINTPGMYTAVPVWESRKAWLEEVEAAALVEPAALKRVHVSLDALLRVSRADAERADSATGRNVATSNDTVAAALGVSPRTVQRARQALRELGYSVTVADGRYLTTQERRQAGARQIRAASTRALIHPQRPPRGHRRTRPRIRRGVLPPVNSLTRVHSPNKTKTSANVGKRCPAPIGLQRLAAQLDKRLPRLVPHRHIGALVTALQRALIHPETTADQLLAGIERGNIATDRYVIDPADWTNPLGYFVHLLQETPWEELMHPTQCTPARVAAGYDHHFDPVSGWCIHGCNVRNDGRILGRDGRIINPGATAFPDWLDDPDDEEQP